uniref:Protein kinase domain-containing protein n=1 Tax=Chromera velia CCMP2878 TaxID=1169474 RepID=A0A0G4FNQ3_9ALVE|eukprot:Cvel_3527.t1-p1 / transcript=Cvel_3527.t1 / gene=Cvel_3527 / organism=Chromera_velia_CCMP2878 / gene_product=Mitosis inhibitor protein kinase wee1, putative / transcript_product=Mitosis inhibitor protein kinase wee1, putative / location=Cvel_scaffold143:97684-98664(-) / protein_length=327 / sequence_SO=supercontig / SO=protein_coding / is_pseudo=false
MVWVDNSSVHFADTSGNLKRSDGKNPRAVGQAVEQQLGIDRKSLKTWKFTSSWKRVTEDWIPKSQSIFRFHGPKAAWVFLRKVFEGIDADTAAAQASSTLCAPGGRLGSGGQKKVFQCRKPDNEAVAIPLPGHSLCNEVSVMEELKGTPNVIELLNRGPDEQGCPYQVVKMSEDLHKFFEHAGPQAVGRVLFGTANGIKNMHARGFAHFDIKPENILVDEDGNSIVSDLGGAAPMDGRGQALPRALTPGFFPGVDETIAAVRRGVKVDGRYFDSFAFGVTVCQVAARNPHLDAEVRRALHNMGSSLQAGDMSVEDAHATISALFGIQ